MRVNKTKITGNNALILHHLHILRLKVTMNQLTTKKRFIIFSQICDPCFKPQNTNKVYLHR